MTTINANNNIISKKADGVSKQLFFDALNPAIAPADAAELIILLYIINHSFHLFKIFSM